jgi:hypothetical protein
VALIIEDGTGVPNADSYETVAECEAFSLAYFGQNLTGNMASKEASLRRAFYYMQGLRWKPGVYPLFGGTIPAAVKHAQTLFARAEHKNAGALSPDVTLGGQKVLNKVDVLGWEVTGPEATVENSRPIVTAAFDFLRPYLDFDPARDSSIGVTGALVV